ncbi:hypothetical protein CRI94_10930 [Longibacter salinarum]|uniref:Protein kinase domain-containing protein n=1 Tax=Longibacter salinarum TaxID=1850348 RepID=A0A2A8CX01_9BACT|nr:serine/threonine-protein kinase [Longibacter salinarum]PEN13153.1 hypothetical protein CRI94_10930 [Longibacter salinarum]
MTETQWERAKEILNDLLDAAPDDVGGWLDSRCSGEPALRSEVESLYYALRDGKIDEEAGAAAWLGTSQPGDDAHRQGLFPFVGLGARTVAENQPVVGRYRLLEEIGAGGMGVVYRAERADGAFERPVAVKLLRRRIVSPDTETRFRTERQVLASLDHPHIAGLIDGGVTEDGRPYLVMEFVDGTPITDYADDNALTMSERVDLLTQVITAVYAAHQNLIVHRDLKPSNVLVTETETGPRVKLLDFGIAKILGGDLPVTRPVTQTGRALMTPAYAAPEQITEREISTATDTYQLGVLAYELFTGTPPFGQGDKSRGQVDKEILETPPEAPSSRGAATGGDAHRLKGDLDTIVLKALRKEPDRRYASPDAMRRDLQRYQDAEPIEARPATWGYRTRKFVRRNRWGVATGVAVICLALAFASVIVQERNAAQRQAEKAEQVSAFLVRLFEAADPNLAPGDTVSVRMLLERGQKRLETLDDPSVKGQMAHVLGQTYRRLGEFEKARALLQTSVRLRTRLRGDDHPATLKSMSALGLLERDQGRYEAADTLMERVVAGRRAVRGRSDSTVVQALMFHGFILRKLGDTPAAEQRLRTALRAHRSRQDTANILTAELLFNLAALLKTQGKIDEALPVQRRSFHLVDSLTDGPHPGRIANLNNLAILQAKRGAYPAAESLYIRLLDEGTALYGRDHPRRARWMSNLGSLYTNQFEYKSADSLLLRALDMEKQTRDGPHPQTALILHNLAVNAHQQGDLARARRRFAEALEMMQVVHDAPDQRIARLQAEYGSTLLHLGRLSDAEGVLTQSRDAFRSLNQKPNADCGDVLLRMGRLRLEQGRHEDADSLATVALGHFRTEDDTSEVELFRGRLLRADIATAVGDLDRAASIAGRARLYAKDLPAQEHWRRYVLQRIRGEIALERDSLEHAHRLLQEAHTSLQEIRGASSVATEATQKALQAVNMRAEADA